MCKENKANYLTIRNGGVERYCADCIKLVPNRSVVMDNPAFWNEQ